jgi:hypothetical protein
MYCRPIGDVESEGGGISRLTAGGGGEREWVTLGRTVKAGMRKFRCRETKGREETAIQETHEMSSVA